MSNTLRLLRVPQRETPKLGIPRGGPSRYGVYPLAQRLAESPNQNENPSRESYESHESHENKSRGRAWVEDETPQAMLRTLTEQPTTRDEADAILIDDADFVSPPLVPSVSSQEGVLRSRREPPPLPDSAKVRVAEQQHHQPAIALPARPRSLEERQKQLADRLDSVRMQNAQLAFDEKRLEGEIASVKEGLEMGPGGAGHRKRLPLARMMIASPCNEPWGRMVGDERKRFCKSCQKDVHNLSAMSSGEVEAFLDANANGNACIRLYERTDGTILTTDCPVGLSRRRRRAVVLATIGAGACALFGFTSLSMLMSEPRIHVVEVPGPTVVVTQTIPTPVAPPVVISASYTQLPAAPARMGWVLIDAPEGTKIYEGQRLIGTGPTVVTLATGSHSLRAEGPAGLTAIDGKWSQTQEVSIRDSDKTNVRFQLPERRWSGTRAGGMRAPPVLPRNL